MCEEAAEEGVGPSESVERASRWHCAYRKAEVEEADCSGGKQERTHLVISFRGGEDDLSTVATLFWAEGVWMSRWKG